MTLMAGKAVTVATQLKQKHRPNEVMAAMGVTAVAVKVEQD